jgi:hypothetical protein
VATLLGPSRGPGMENKATEPRLAPAVATVMFLTTAVIVLHAVYVKLRFGTWPGLNVVDALQWAFTEKALPWAYSPMDWIGLHSLLAAIPLWAITGAACFVAVLVDESH